MKTDTKHLTSRQLADRWGIKEGTLRNWRYIGEGPAFMKVGRSIRYRMANVLYYEKGMQRAAKHRGRK